MTGFELIQAVANDDCAKKTIIIRILDEGSARFFSIDSSMPGRPTHLNDRQAYLTASSELVFCEACNQFEGKWFRCFIEEDDRFPSKAAAYDAEIEIAEENVRLYQALVDGPFGWRFDEPPKILGQDIRVHGVDEEVFWQGSKWYYWTLRDDKNHLATIDLIDVKRGWQYIPSDADLERLKGLKR